MEVDRRVRKEVDGLEVDRKSLRQISISDSSVQLCEILRHLERCTAFEASLRNEMCLCLTFLFLLPRQDKFRILLLYHKKHQLMS